MRFTFVPILSPLHVYYVWWVCAHVCVQTFVPLSAWRPEENAGCPSTITYLYISLRWNISEHGAVFFTILGDSLFSFLHRTGIIDMCVHSQLFTWVLGN